jgi:hypothetical protein
MIEKICTEGPFHDQAGWLARSKPTRTSQRDLFTLLDRNSDLTISLPEYEHAYRMLDGNTDGEVSYQEV